ncbi:hypothetical protein K3495_g7364 [Podosphaera aphanis]|nr:hypothetical protein K3495_g7364 [Podosphaera aphanis]
MIVSEAWSLLATFAQDYPWILGEAWAWIIVALMLFTVTDHLIEAMSIRINDVTPNKSKDGLSSEALDVNTSLQEIRELRQRIDDGPILNRIPAETTPEVVIIKDPARSSSKRNPTEFKTYNGDRSNYPAWRRAVLPALKIDWNTFEYTFEYTDSYVFLKIYETLEGKAQNQAAAYFESGGLRGEEGPEYFIAFLDRSNLDPTRITRARAELNAMKMGPKQRWSAFLL